MTETNPGQAAEPENRDDASTDPQGAAPVDDPEAPLYSTVPLEAEDGSTYVIRQQNVGTDNELGGGEWPDPQTPSQAPAPGSV